MRFSLLTLAAALSLPFLTTVLGGWPPAHCADVKGLNDMVGWWPELEIPKTAKNTAEFFNVQLTTILDQETIGFQMSVFPDGTSTIDINQDKGYNQVYRVNFKQHDGHTIIKSFIFQSNAGLCNGHSGVVPLKDVGHVTVEMMKL